MSVFNSLRIAYCLFFNDLRFLPRVAPFQFDFFFYLIFAAIYTLSRAPCSSPGVVFPLVWRGQ
jgi:hypothetical protein